MFQKYFPSIRFDVVLWAFFLFLSFFFFHEEISVSREIGPGVKKDWIARSLTDDNFGSLIARVTPDTDLLTPGLAEEEDSSIQTTALEVPERNRIRGRRKEEATEFRK